MDYLLILGDRAYSSWSLRIWLIVEHVGIPVRTRFVSFAERSVADQLAAIPPARTVPALRTPEGAVVWESIAIVEELATRHPEAGIWPADPAARATARSLAAEMHAGFTELRAFCPMNLRLAYRDVPVPDAVTEDVGRIEALWAHARARHGDEGPWLFGAYSAADAFFAPVAARIAGYDLAVGPEAAAYVAAHLRDPAFRRWRAVSRDDGPDLPWYARTYPTRPWPGPD